MEIRLIVGTFIVTFLVKQVIMLYTSQKKVYINYDRLLPQCQDYSGSEKYFWLIKKIFSYSVTDRNIFQSSGHARLLEPPSRASMWRMGFDTPENFDDDQTYCG